VVVRLGIVEARVLAAGGLPMGFLDLWCHIVAEVVDGFHRLVVGDIEDMGFGYAVEAGEVDWGCFGGAGARMKALAFALVGD
jgi:hypothetical protein